MPFDSYSELYIENKTRNSVRMRWLKTTTICVRTTGFRAGWAESIAADFLYAIDNKQFTTNLMRTLVWPPPCNHLT